MAGCLSAADFLAGFQTLAEAWNGCDTCNGDWTHTQMAVRSCAGSQMDIARLRCHLLQGASCFELRTLQQAPTSCLEESYEDKAEEPDAALASSPPEQWHSYTYHMLHHPSYQVPTLCLRSFTAGKPWA